MHLRRTFTGMAARKQNFVVFVEQTHDNGIIVEEVTAHDSYEALNQVLDERFEPDRHSKYVRNSWVVRGKLC
jgi:hypothetical protein